MWNGSLDATARGCTFQEPIPENCTCPPGSACAKFGSNRLHGGTASDPIVGFPLPDRRFFIYSLNFSDSPNGSIRRPCAKMRINTEGKKAWRTDLYESTQRALDEGTKSGAIDAACRHTKQDLRNKEQLFEWCEQHLTIEETEELLELLSTDIVELEHRSEFAVSLK